MSKAMDRLAQATARLSATSEEREDDPVVPVARRAPVRTDPIRSTVDLPPRRHDALAAWADEASVELGLPVGRRGVTRQDVLEAAVAVLLTDATVAARVRAYIRDEKRKRRTKSGRQ